MQRGWQIGEKMWVVFIFMPRSNCTERQCPGHFRHQQQMSQLVGEKCSLSSPPHFPFPGKAQGNKIKSSITIFYIENALEFELWIQMALKESARGALYAARWQESHEGEPAAAASNRDNTTGGSFLFHTVQNQPHSAPVQGFPHLTKIVFCVQWNSLPRVDSEISLGLLGSWTSVVSHMQGCWCPAS